MMKSRFINSVVLAGLLTAAARGGVLDNFDAYTAGTVGTVSSGAWTNIGGTGSPAAVQGVSGNFALSVGQAPGTASGAWKTLPTPIAASDTATTLFVRLRANSANNDGSFGLSDLAAPGANFSDFEAQFRIVDGNPTAGTIDIEARSGAAFVDLLTGAALNTWYNVWMVIDNSTDTWKAYINTGLADATEADLKVAGIAFRNGAAANPLSTFLAIGGTSTDSYGQSIDDIHINAGQVLTNFSPPPIVLGDTNGNGLVELDDFNPIRDNFQKLVATRALGDLNLSGKVDFLDFREWKTAYVAGGGSLAGINLSFLAVPEPATELLALLTLGGAIFAQRRVTKSAVVR